MNTTRVIFITEDFATEDTGLLVLGRFTKDNELLTVKIHQKYRTGQVMGMSSVTLSWQEWQVLTQFIRTGASRPTNETELRRLTGLSSYHFPDELEDGSNSKDRGNDE